MEKILHAGDSCIIVEFENSIDRKTNARVQALRETIEKKPFRGFIETIPAYRSLAISFDPLLAPDDLDKLLLRLAQNAGNAHKEEEIRRLLVAPTCYEGDFAPDIEKIAANAGISIDEVIRRHSAGDYYCYMLGFLPGFPYLGGMEPSLSTPRLETPREKIPAGSVAIGGNQTGIYPIDSPGGWNLIGKTPLRLFDPTRNPAILLEAGMWVRFLPIDMAEFRRQETLAALPGWKPEVREEIYRNSYEAAL